MSSPPLFDLRKRTPEDAEQAARELLEAARGTLGFVPNLYGLMADVPDVLSAYVSGSEAFRQKSGFDPVEQETIFLTISKANDCDYCIAAHSMVADKASGVPADVLAALRSGTELPDPKLNSLANFTRTMVQQRGAPSPEDARDFRNAGYTAKHALGVVLAIGMKTLSNYVNHLAATPIDDAFASYAP
ncbi:MAG: carboxymuconolactone decarboxylase family protein [Myxococcota bacterium]